MQPSLLCTRGYTCFDSQKRNVSSDGEKEETIVSSVYVFFVTLFFLRYLFIFSCFPARLREYFSCFPWPFHSIHNTEHDRFEHSSSNAEGLVY